MKIDDYERHSDKISAEVEGNDEEELKRREDLIMKIAKKMLLANDIEGLTKLLTTLRPFLLSYGMAKAAKLIRNLIDWCLKIGGDSDFKLALCMECIHWAKQQNRIFLRYMLEVRLMRLMNEIGRHADALTMGKFRFIHPEPAEPEAEEVEIYSFPNELKKVGDKDIQLEVHLEESKAAFALNNLNRSRAALVAARIIANSLCIDTKLQAQLDIESGILNMAEDQDFRTAYSYFYEAFENFDANEDEANAQKALKYMCLAKIMLNEELEVHSILSSKLAAKYSGRDLDAIRTIAEALENRSLQNYYKAYNFDKTKAFDEYNVELQSDIVIRRHVDSLADTVLEKNISRAIEPFKLRAGVINQQDDTLIVYNFPHDMQTKTFITSVEIIHGLSQIVDEICSCANAL
ncbi:hypothetical protein X798_03405 [Onchocerca flexuosa]|uniref:26S proteasome regulatory subunit Rpn6 N-terminal domain-containing protein n=1 Tax=Onchocerca flexuosa TaxID=387005 RepID=A0A238BVU7_9BILA|nr:hypothetical protein X798_03405 [Onchocerca flexuosa]